MRKNIAKNQVTKTRRAGLLVGAAATVVFVSGIWPPQGLLAQNLIISCEAMNERQDRSRQQREAAGGRVKDGGRSSASSLLPSLHYSHSLSLNQVFRCHGNRWKALAPLAAPSGGAWFCLFAL